jgi:hypothetical protein
MNKAFTHRQNYGSYQVKKQRMDWEPPTHRNQSGRS